MNKNPIWFALLFAVVLTAGMWWCNIFCMIAYHLNQQEHGNNSWGRKQWTLFLTAPINIPVLFLVGFFGALIDCFRKPTDGTIKLATDELQKKTSLDPRANREYDTPCESIFNGFHCDGKNRHMSDGQHFNRVQGVSWSDRDVSRITRGRTH